MSPAVVDFRTPATTRRVQSENPNPSEASTSGNTNEGSFDTSFASPSVSRIASGKPSVPPSSRRSKPRLVKVRRQSGARQVGSTPDSEARAYSSFNPFRPVSTSLDQNEMQDLRDQWQSWNPFFPGSAQKTGGSNAFGAASSSDLKFGKPNIADFVFVANPSSMTSNSNLEKSGLGESVGESLLHEMRKLNFGNQSEQKASEDSTFSFSAAGGESSSSGVFVYGSNSKKSYDFDGNRVCKLQDEKRNLNNEGFQNQNNADKPKNADFISKGSGENSFVFGGSDNGESLASQIPESMKKLNLKDSGNVGGSEKSKDADPNSKANFKSTFVFGSGRSTGGFSDSSSATTLPVEPKKLNIQGSGNDDGIEKMKETSFKASSNNIFVFGSSKKPASDGAESVLPDEMRKLNIGNQMRGHTGQMNTSSSYRTSVKETQRDPAVENPIPTPPTFQPGVQGKNLGVGQVPSYQPNDENVTRVDGAAASSSSFSSTGYQSAGNVFEMPSTDGAESKSDFSFTSTRDGSGTPFMDFRTPKQNSTFASTANFFADLNQQLDFSAKKGASKDQRLKKRKGKRQSAMLNRRAGQEFISRESSSQENLESPGSYSPMDFSPYQEPKGSRETSMASDGSFHLDNSSVSTDAQQTVSSEATAEVLAAETQQLHINGDDPKCREMNDDGFKNGFEQNVGVGHLVDESLSGAETEYFRSEAEKVDMDSNAGAATTTTETSFSSNLEKQESDLRVPFTYASTSEDAGETNFTFAASSSMHGHSSASKFRYRKKNRLKLGQDSYNTTPNAKFQMTSTSSQFFPFASSTLLSGAGQSKRGDSSTSESKGQIRSETDKEPDVKQGSISTAAPPTAAQECEKWRLRGNQAYANGHSSIAEDYYTRGVNCISPNETSISCLEALVLCYSNRAATRMALGRMREALEDCKTAAAIDSSFLKVQVRAANCHLALGEIEEAAKYFKICLQSGTSVCLDRKLVIEASNGLQKAQQVAQHIDRSIELLHQRKQSDAEKVLQIVAEGLSISPYSEKLVEMKAEALFMLRKYEEVIQLCELTLDSAERNSVTVSSGCQLVKMDSSISNKGTAERLWRVHYISKSYFYLGKLEEALDLLEKHKILRTAVEKSKTLESLMTLAATLHELLQHKAAGNEAFQSGRHSEAVEHYTAALSCNVESRPFAAICICNRAAAYQMLGQITDAIADCSLAIALDGNYPKAISRRATLHERIRDYGQAVNDLERYLSLLEKQSEDKTGAKGKSTSSVNDLRQARLRLSSMEEEAKKGIPLDMYLILGVEPTGTASDIKKAYRKAALRHHPDKAGQFLARTDNGDDGLWKEIAEEIHKDADRLFKMIGEAYAVLFDPTKRSRYDLEEEFRNSQKKGGGNTARTPTDVHNYPFERSASRRQWREAWKSYGNQHHHWSEASRSNRYS
ncbi:uncharacterized protein LOC122064035 isoform X2 [Macadamia integrifolia]|uniref:uncharacterized protein LOC122064035 isoform X2 n=1 Tax=Macadamia integrifolia TaxID=60698 RepID=UPI001C4F2FC5|nr:uncharacterized protein LOC122064035 isoform X2 [Macadamia integrifolia]